MFLDLTNGLCSIRDLSLTILDGADDEMRGAPSIIRDTAARLIEMVRPITGVDTMNPNERGYLNEVERLFHLQTEGRAESSEAVRVTNLIAHYRKHLKPEELNRLALLADLIRSNLEES